jgi:hypothetical protein
VKAETKITGTNHRTKIFGYRADMKKGGEEGTKGFQPPDTLLYHLVITWHRIAIVGDESPK